MNRKNWLVLKLILLVLLFIALCAGVFGTFTFSSYRSEGRSRVHGSVSTMQGQAAPFDNVEKIVVDSISLPVSIYESDVDRVTVWDNSKAYGFGSRNSNSLYQEGGTLTFRQGNRLSFFNFVKGDIVIEVPRGMVLEYNVENVSGSINHDAPSKGTLHAKSVSGSVRVMQGGEDLYAKSTSGSVRIFEPFKTATAKSTSGTVRASVGEQTKQLSCSSTSGSVNIQMGAVSGYELKYSSVSGSVRDLYSNVDYSKSGTITQGDGAAKIEASSVSGSIKLTDWD